MGGGIRTLVTSFILENSTIANNTARNGGGIKATGGTSNDI